MPDHISKIAGSLKELGEIQVSEWDFMGLMNTEIQELELARSLRRLGQIRVMEWDFRTVLPAVKKTANQEVDLLGFFRRTAHWKVMEWDFRSSQPAVDPPLPVKPVVPLGNVIDRDEMQAIILRLKNFLQFVTVNLIDEPAQAQIKVTQIGPSGLRFKLILVKKDVAMLIGREGFTAAAIRNILKAAAEMKGVQALLQIHSHEDELAFLAREEAKL